MINNPLDLRFVQLASVPVVISTDGWADWDISAAVGTVSRLVFVQAGPEGPIECGVRTKGSALDTHVTVQNSTVIMACTDADGVLETWRNGTNWHATILGYLI